MTKKHYKWNEGADIGDHSRIKHEILEHYFRRYLIERCKNPVIRRFRLAIVDGFAGGGIYGDKSPGSPLVFSKTLLETTKEINIGRTDKGLPILEIDCMLILNDSDPTVKKLQRKALAPIQALAKEDSSNVMLNVEFYCGEFESLVDGFIERVESYRYRNMIYNLDQYGISDVTRSTISKLMRSENSVEVFLTYAIEALVIYLNRKDTDKAKRQLRNLELEPGAMGFANENLKSKEWMGSAERVIFEHFLKCAPFVTPFAVVNPRGYYYWLLHFANHRRARQVYNDVLHEKSGLLAHFGRSGLQMLSYNPDDKQNMLYQFDEEARKAARGQLVEDLPSRVSEFGDSVEISRFYNSIYNETPAHSDDIHDKMINNPDLEVLTRSGNPRRSPKQILPTDILRLKSQKSFFFFFENNKTKKNE